MNRRISDMFNAQKSSISAERSQSFRIVQVALGLMLALSPAVSLSAEGKVAENKAVVQTADTAKSANQPEAGAPSPAAVSAFAKVMKSVKGWFSRVGETLKHTDIKFNLPVKLVEGQDFKFGARYTFESEPSYLGNIHLRADHWTISTTVPIGDSVRVINGNSMGAEINKEARITFIRPYGERKFDSKELLAYSPARFPWTADIAMERLQVGDVAVLTSELSLLVDAKMAPEIAEALKKMNKGLPFIETHYVIRSEFQIHVTRLQEDWFQFKVIPVFGNEFGLKAAIKPAERIEVFGVRLLDKRVERWSRIDRGILFAEFSRRDGVLGMINYRLNLNPRNTEVREAYNRIIQNSVSTSWMNSLGLEPDDLGGFAGLTAAALSTEIYRLFDPTSSKIEKIQGLVTDAAELELLLKKSLVIAPNYRAIDRDFFGRAEFFEPGNTAFGVNLLLWRAGRSSEYKDLFIAAESSEGKPTEYYRVGLFDRLTESSLFFSIFQKRAVSSAMAVFGSDIRQDIKELRDLDFEWVYRDKDFSKSDQRMVREALEQSLPPVIYNQIDWGGFQVGESYKAAQLKLRMVFDPKAVAQLMDLNMEVGAHWMAITEYLKSIPMPTAPMASTHANAGETEAPVSGKNRRILNVDYYKEDIATIATKLTAVLEGVESVAGGSRKLTPKQRYEAFSDLRLSPLFIEVGAGYLLSLLDPSLVPKLVGFELNLTAEKTAPAVLPQNLGRQSVQFRNISTIRSALRTGVRGSLADLYQDVAEAVRKERITIETLDRAPLAQ